MDTDGRNTRWDEHRSTRRRELVSHTLRAIRIHGAAVGMDEIAARAGTSKTVIYRHFGDRAGLYDAVVASVHDYIHAGLMEAVNRSSPEDFAAFVGELADSYLGLVERDSEIYRFVMSPPAAPPGGDPAGDLPQVIGHHVGQALAARYGIDHAVAHIWGTGVIGFIRATADQWMAQDPRPPRATVVAATVDLFAPAFAVALAAPSPT